ncbi:hypothetical protein [Pseudoduganella sp.]|uniref:hypothetical protein n=1 Tax=Pseudoduganella sp. TaxID=1880898 RepID=UPI0035B4D11F
MKMLAVALSIGMSGAYAQSPIPIEHIIASSSNRVSRYIDEQISNSFDEETIAGSVKTFVQKEGDVVHNERKAKLSDLGFHCQENGCMYIGVHMSENRAVDSLMFLAVEIHIGVNYAASPIEVFVQPTSIRKNSSTLRGSMIGEFLHLHAPTDTASGFPNLVHSFLTEAPADLEKAGFICFDLCRYEGVQSRTIYNKGVRSTERYKYSIRIGESRKRAEIDAKQERID